MRPSGSQPDAHMLSGSNPVTMQRTYQTVKNFYPRNPLPRRKASAGIIEWRNSYQEMRLRVFATTDYSKPDADAPDSMHSSIYFMRTYRMEPNQRFSDKFKNNSILKIYRK